MVSWVESVETGAEFRNSLETHQDSGLRLIESRDPRLSELCP